MSFRSTVIAAAIAATATLLAAPAHAQSTNPPDTAGVPRLPTITTTAEPEGLLRRIWTMQEKRQEVIELERENRRLVHELRGYDRRIEVLEQRLDTLIAWEAEMLRQIQAIDSATAATRAARLALEKRLRLLDENVARGRPPHGER